MLNLEGTARVWQQNGGSRTPPRLARNWETHRDRYRWKEEVTKDEEDSPDGGECVHTLSGRPRKTLGLCDLLDIPCCHVDRERCGA